MKAWVVYYKGYDWVDFLHAEDEKTARKMFYSEWLFEGEYIETRAKRLPKYDGRKIDVEELVREDEWPDSWLDGVYKGMCRCEKCRPPR